MGAPESASGASGSAWERLGAGSLWEVPGGSGSFGRLWEAPGGSGRPWEARAPESARDRQGAPGGEGAKLRELRPPFKGYIDLSRSKGVPLIQRLQGPNGPLFRTTSVWELLFKDIAYWRFAANQGRAASAQAGGVNLGFRASLTGGKRPFETIYATEKLLPEGEWYLLLGRKALASAG